MAEGEIITALHYVGYDEDRGGILAVVRALAGENRFRCVLGVNPSFQAGRSRLLPSVRFPRVDGEIIGLANAWRARRVAREVRAWLREDRRRIFHGHSRAGLLVALWLCRDGERRALATIHCYGRQRWFYRWAVGRLGPRLVWLSPAMKAYYGLADVTWTQCIPGCIPPAPPTPTGPGQAARTRGTERVRLGGIGALVRWKRWDLVLRALALLPSEVRKNFSFRHIGADDGSADSRVYREELQRMTAELGLRETVEWRGEQPSSAALLREIDCLVVASHREPLSVAMLESLQAGVPVLAADSGGAVDVISPDLNGWLFPDGDAAALARRLARLDADGMLTPPAFDSAGRFAAASVAAAYADMYARLEELR